MIPDPIVPGRRKLQAIFPDENATSSSAGSETAYYASSDLVSRRSTSSDRHANAFPDVIDVMVRVLTTAGAGAIAEFEAGNITAGLDVDGNALSNNAYWWQLAEEHSRVYVRRIRVLPSGI